MLEASDGRSLVCREESDDEDDDDDDEHEHEHEHEHECECEWGAYPSKGSTRQEGKNPRQF
jgi:ABC-type Zn2+ transport system substrate-binding protein/surface adhesin